jgi:serine-type D-Ala-D-Ala endopeptidase (penicillin-binding protein 7)
MRKCGHCNSRRNLNTPSTRLDLSGFLGILKDRSPDLSRDMRIKLITLLLLSHSLLAHAGDDVLAANTQSHLTPLAQNEQPPLLQLEQLSQMQMPAAIDADKHVQDEELDVADSDEHEQDDELAADEFPVSADAKPTKAFDDLLKIMPQLGYATSKARQTGELDSAAKKSKLDTAVMKFASMPRMRSSIVLIYDENGNQPLHSKNSDVVAPIASITKLMTAMVVLDAKLPLDEEISLSAQDINKQKRTRSRMRTGMTLTRGELLKLALMASENLSAAALARTYPGGTEAALLQMNAKARELGMNSTRFMDPTGLNSGNVSTANDLVKMVRAAREYELIHQFTTSTSHTYEQVGHRALRFHNTNPLVKNTSWDIGLSKTGYISEAGRCLVMEAKITEHPVIIVLLDSWGKNSRVGDANRVKKWMENASVRGNSSKNM